nr:hypothetical protein [Tanacetum cinerariifolium]
EQWAYLSAYPSKCLTSFCYDDDDEDYTSAITPDEPVLSTEEPANSLSMGDEHLDTIPATKSDEFIKSGVENLIPIPNQFENFSESNKEFSLIDDDSFSIDDIDCVEASPSDSELTKSSFTSLNSLLEETNTFDNSFPEFESFCFDVEEISSGSTTTYLDISLPKYEAFYDDHVKEISSGNPTTHSDSPSLCFVHVEPNSRDFTKDVVEDISPTKEPQVLNTLTTHPSLQLNMKFQPSSESLFTYVVWIFLPFLVFLVAPHYLLSLRNEDIIFNPGICKSTFSRSDISHQYGTVKKFNTHRSHLNKCLMLIHG